MKLKAKQILGLDSLNYIPKTGNTVSTPASSIYSTLISGGTLYGDGSNLIGITTTDYYVTGGTFTGTTLTLNRQNGPVFITGFTSSSGGGTFTGGTVDGFTTFTNGLSASTISATSFTGDGSGLTNVTSSNVSSKLFNYYNFI
jgi:hypothetical protein